MINVLLMKLAEVNEHDPKRINHGFKVYCLCKLLAYMENLDERTSAIIEAAGVLHDIAIRHTEEHFSCCSGKYQEKHGPIVAKPILETVTDDKDFIDRVLYLIGHHHTYTGIDGIDYQILIESDFMVNVEEGNITLKAFINAREKFFSTSSGIKLSKTYLAR